MIIYLDIAFLVTLAMNFSIFYITKKFLKLEAGIIRVFLGSFVSAIVYIASLFWSITILGFASLIVGLLIIFGKKRILKIFIYTHLIAFLIGGMTFALYNYGILQNFSFILLLFSTSCVYIFLVTYKKIKNQYYTLEIKIEGEKFEFKALLDTGNSLTYENKPVAIVDYHRFGNISEKTEILIPYKTITEEGFLKGFVPEETKINGKSIEIVIAISEVPLSSDFNAIIGPTET